MLVAALPGSDRARGLFLVKSYVFTPVAVKHLLRHFYIKTAVSVMIYLELLV